MEEIVIQKVVIQKILSVIYTLCHKKIEDCSKQRGFYEEDLIMADKKLNKSYTKK